MNTISKVPQIDAKEEKRRAIRRRRKVKAEEMDYKKKRLSEEQVKFLEMSFGEEKRLESWRKLHLASESGLDPKTVAVWFQNKRASWKKKHMQEEYTNLKSQHETTLIQNFQFQAEVLKLTEQLLGAQKEIEKLTSLNKSSSCSPTTSYSLGNNKIIDDGFAPYGGGDDFFLMDHEIYSYVDILDYPNLYGI